MCLYVGRQPEADDLFFMIRLFVSTYLSNTSLFMYYLIVNFLVVHIAINLSPGAQKRI
jgi:hypothetical protein